MSNQTPLTLADVEIFAARLRATVAKAERTDAIAAALGKIFTGAAAPASVKAPAKAAKGTSARGGARISIEGSRVVEALKSAKDGLTLGALAAALGERSTERVRYALGKLRASRSVRMTGKKSTAKYHAA